MRIVFKKSDCTVYDSFFSVLIPNIVYSGQKLIKLVSTKTAANINRTIPNTPVITFVK